MVLRTGISIGIFSPVKHLNYFGFSFKDIQRNEPASLSTRFLLPLSRPTSYLRSVRPKPGRTMNLTIFPATVDRWDDLEILFGPRGACAGCWCMYYRKTAKTFKQDSGDVNHADLKELVISSAIAPGLIGYLDDKPVAWIAIAPRDEYPRLTTSRIMRASDSQPCWVVTCLFVDKAYCNQGLSTAMVEAATAFAFENGATVVEGFPHDLQGDTQPAPFVWTGLMGSFVKAGFVEVERRSPKRPLMRKMKNR